MRIRILSVLLVALLFCSGCLSFDLTATVSPAGRLLGTTSLTAPLWLSRRWFGDQVKTTNATLPMIESMNLFWKMRGVGAWINAASIEDYKTPFLSFRYGDHGDAWQIWGIMHFDAKTMALMEKELKRRANQIPRIRKDRAPKLADAMLRQAKFEITLRTSGKIVTTNGSLLEDNVVRWTVRFADLQAHKGKVFLTIEGTRTWAQRWLAALDRILPTGELD